MDCWNKNKLNKQYIEYILKTLFKCQCFSHLIYVMASIFFMWRVLEVDTCSSLDYVACCVITLKCFIIIYKIYQLFKNQFGLFRSCAQTEVTQLCLRPIKRAQGVSGKERLKASHDFCSQSFSI